MSAAGAAVAPPRPTVAPFAAVSFTYFAYAGLISTYGAALVPEPRLLDARDRHDRRRCRAATRLVSPYAWGWLADHTGRRERLLRLAAAARCVASLGYFVRRATPGSRGHGVLFLCTAGVIPISEATLAHRVSSGGSSTSAATGGCGMWGSVGFVGAVTASGFILQAIGVERFPLLVVVLLARLLVAGMAPAGARREAPHPQAAAAGALAVLRQPVVAWFFAGIFLTVLAHTSLYAFYSLYLASLGYGKSAIGLLWAVGVVVEVVWFWFQGRWLHRLSMHAWLVVAALASALRFALIAAFGGHAAVLVAAAGPPCAQLRGAALGLHRRHHPPLPGRLRGRGRRSTPSSATARRA